MRAIHTAERQLLRSAQQQEIAMAMAQLSSAAQSLRSAGMAAIAGQYASRRAGLMTMDAAAREAALARLRDEEAAEAAAFAARCDAAAMSERRVVLGGLKARHREARGVLAARHRGDRLGLVAGRIGMAPPQPRRRQRVQLDRQRAVLACQRPKRRARGATITAPKGA